MLLRKIQISTARLQGLSGSFLTSAFMVLECALGFGLRVLSVWGGHACLGLTNCGVRGSPEASV